MNHAARIQDVEPDVQTSPDRIVRPDEFDGGVAVAACWNRSLSEWCVTRISDDKVATYDWNPTARCAADA